MSLFVVRVTILEWLPFCLKLWQSWQYCRFWAWFFLHEQKEKSNATRLGESTLVHINIDGPSLGNFDTENFFPDLSECSYFETLKLAIIRLEQ